MKNSKLKIFALIGYPIGHTLSPYMHNAAFLKLKIKAIYIPLSVEPKDLKKAIDTLKSADISGFNVTIPFKSSCMRYLDKVDRLSSMIGAVNTVVVEKKKLIGYNTDASGFLKSAHEDLGFKARNKRCLIIGAGGAARAVAFALAKEGARQILITDVIRNKADSLAKNIRRYFPRCKAASIKLSTSTSALTSTLAFTCHLLVNATPLGMRKTDPLPINPKLLRKDMKVYDLVYNLPVTKLVKTARHKKIKAANGLGMLLHQGAQAFELWLHRKAPIEVMRKALFDHI